MERVKALWANLLDHAHAHHKAYHRMQHGMHLCYLGMVAFHGPYFVAAGGLFVLMILGLILHLEGEL